MGKTFLYNNCIRVAKSDKLLPEKRGRERDRKYKDSSIVTLQYLSH